MSVKIYNAFRFQMADLLEVHRLCMAFRNVLKPLAREKAARWLVGRAVEILDRRTIKKDAGGSLEHSPFYAAWEEMLEKVRRVEREQIREPDVDFSFSITVLPHASGLYGIAYTEQREFLDKWFAYAGVTDYHYQDSSDRPESSSEQEWECRARVWEDLLGHDTAAERGFSVDIVLVSAAVSSSCLSRVGEYLPPFEKRVERIAYDLLVEEKLRDVPEEVLKRKFGSLIMAVNQEKDSDPVVKGRYEEIKALTAEMLYREVDKELLLREPAKVVPKVKAAPTPWRVKRTGGYIAINDSAGQPVFKKVVSKCTIEEYQQLACNLEFIVASCNKACAG